MTQPDELPSAPRALRDHDLREQRVALAKTAPSVLELNRLVWRIGGWEDLRDDEAGTVGIPYLDPTYGGVDAGVVLLLKSPQADADVRRGADRLISLDNDDEVAATLFEMLDELGIDRRRCVAWNMCPFPTVGFDPSDSEYERGRKYFEDFINLIHNPRAVVVMGSSIGRGWRSHGFTNVLAAGAEVVFAPSPSPPGIDRPGNRERLRTALARAFANR